MPRTLTATPLVAAAVLAASASAAVNPFTESFDLDNAAWRQSDSATPLAWSAAGGPDAGPYASATFNFATSGPGSTPAIFRGHASFGASAGAFVGNWLTDGVDTLSFDVRHDAGVPMTFFSRIATAGNFPAAVGVSFAPVPSGVWTSITLPVTPSLWILEGPFSFESVFTAVGNVQIGVDAGALANVDQDFTFDIDNVSITPSPGVLTLAGIGALAALRRRR